MAIDLQQFHQTFFAESLEGLDLIEQSLLQLRRGADGDPELINQIFRAAHSIKGGSGTFGFSAIADFTHLLETLLDEARARKRVLDAASVDLLLRACDCLRAMVHALQAGEPMDEAAARSLTEALQDLLAGPNTDTAAVELPAPAGQAHWRIHFAPQPQILQSGNEPLRLFRELASLGRLRVQADTHGLPGFGQLVPDDCYLRWQLWLAGPVSRAQILEVFEWVANECELEVDACTEAECHGEPEPRPEAQAQPAGAPAPARPSAPAASAPANASIRVGIDKVDSLINLVGQLVITQSMLSELGSNFDMSKLERLHAGLEQLMQDARELQESVMRIRMLPISFAFNRFPRLIHDLTSRTGKQVQLTLHGEQTELDKTVMEQISDPLVHLVRNAIDHGLEPPEERRAAGKPASGTLALHACHRGGSIVIEVRDDGRGLDPQRILDKARGLGLVAADAELSAQQIQELIFEPGFSTADTVSDLSGRGVGMDVVRRNITALGGQIEIDSKPGAGTTFRVYLPLTLAILDGQLVRVGAQVYVIPLVAIVESLQIKPAQLNQASGNLVLYRLRDDNVPVLPLAREFHPRAEPGAPDQGLLVVVEAGGEKLGLLVDDLLAQQQVVIKSLESNYKRVDGIAGATILGDGSVALILDVPGLLAQSARRAPDQHKAA